MRHWVRSVLVAGVLMYVCGGGVLFADPPLVTFTPDILTRIRAKRAANDSDWVAILGSSSVSSSSDCAYKTRTTAGTPDGMPNVYAPREPSPGAPAGSITNEYYGSGYVNPFHSLSACYFASAVADPTNAAKYKAQALKIVRAVAAPIAWVTAASPPATWRKLSTQSTPSSDTTRPVYYVSGDGPGGQARVYQNGHTLSVGTAVTLSGVEGCTSANITGKVGAVINVSQWDLVDSGGSPVICNAPGTNYGAEISAYAGSYAIRNYAFVLAYGYSWFYSDLTTDERTRIQLLITEAIEEFAGLYFQTQTSYPYRPRNNFTDPFYAILGIAGTILQNDGVRGSEVRDYFLWWHRNVGQPFYSKWGRNNAGAIESWPYQQWSPGLLLLTWLESEEENLTTDATYPWVWPIEQMKFWVYNTQPTRRNGSDRGFNHFPGSNNTATTQESPWIPTKMWAVREFAERTGHSFSAKFNQYMLDMGAANPVVFSAYRETDEYFRFLYHNSSQSVADWTTEPLSDPEMSNPAGGYGRVVGRSSWTQDAVAFDFFAGPFISDAANGKEEVDQGLLVVQRGGTFLLPYGTGESVRKSNLQTYNQFAGSTSNSTLRQYYSLFYLKRTSTGVVQTPKISSTNLQPGLEDLAPWRPGYSAVQTFPARIDRYEDGGAYVYARAVNQHKHYTYDYPHLPYDGWTREFVYVRPKVFVVYDRTKKLESGAFTYTQFLGWTLTKTPVVAAYGSGLHRTTVSDGDVVKGAITTVLPAGLPTPELVNVVNQSTVYHLRQSPATEQPYNNWLTVIDAGDSVASLEEVARFTTSSNVDVIRLGDNTVVGFTSNQDSAAPTYPLSYTMTGATADIVTHRIGGLSASTTYKVSVSGSDVVINTSGGGIDVASTAAGVLVFTSGPGGANPPVVIDTSSIPTISVGAIPSTCFSASGGDGGPYTWSKTAGNFPGGLSLSGGCIVGTATTAESQTFTMQACDSTPDCGTKELSMTVEADEPRITTTILPGGVVGQVYATTISVEGGQQPYTFSVVSGTLCSDLTLGPATGELSGSLGAPDNCTFTIEVEDDLLQTVTQQYTIAIIGSGHSIAASTQTGSASVVVTFRAVGLPSNAPCSVDLVREGQIANSANSSGSTSVRTVYFNGLTPQTRYTARVSCQWIAPDVSVEFTTKEYGGSVTGGTVVVYRLPPPPLILTGRGVERVTVDYNLPGEAGSSVTETDCLTGCDVSLPLTTGLVYEIGHTWKDANGVAIQASRRKLFVAQ